MNTMFSYSLSGIKYGLGNFTYENTDLAEIIYSNMWKVDFQGIKGHIYYDENGDCLDLVQIKRFQGNSGIFL